MQYELAPQSPALFDDSLMRKPNKASLTALLQSKVPLETTLPDNAQFVLDGGFLLHAVVWPHQATYDEICQVYVKYVLKHYKMHATVVFDGYKGSPSTKSHEQRRRMMKMSSPDIVFTGNMHATTPQAQI